MARSPCCDENGLKKGPWAPEEDQKLVQYIQKHGHGSWRALPKLAGLNRCGKSCRLRWTNYLRPDIKRGKFSLDEEQTILNLHSILGNKWSAIAMRLPGRTDNEIKNYWNTHLKKKLIHMGFDPITHLPRTDFFAALPQLIALANLGEFIGACRPWDEYAARIQIDDMQAAKVHRFLAAAIANDATNTTTSGACTNSAAANDHNNINDMELVNQLLGPQMTSPSNLQGNHDDKIMDQLASINDQIPVSFSIDAYQISDSSEFALQEERSNAAGTPLLVSPRDSPLPPLADFSSFGDQQAGACSTNSGCDAAGSAFPSFWPTELFFDEQFMSDSLEFSSL